MKVESWLRWIRAVGSVLALEELSTYLLSRFDGVSSVGPS